MKTKIMLALILMFGSTLGYTQDSEMSPGKKEKIRTMKIAFISDRMALTPEEAEKFWPIYNEYSAEAEKIHQKGKKTGKHVRPSERYEGLSDKEVEAIIENSFKNDQDALDLKKKYYQKYKSVLSVKKIAKLYDAEEQFKRELIQRIKDKKTGRPGSGPQPDHK